MNMLKPRNTALNEKAMLYKRFLGLEQSTSLDYAYETKGANEEVKHWYFDKLSASFCEIGANIAVKNIINVTYYDKFVYKGIVYEFDANTNSWTTEPVGHQETLDIHFAPTAKYQTNRYYYVGTFDFMIKGGIEGTTTQRLKGNAIQLDALNIKYYDDTLSVNRDDLVVIEDRLFVVEDTEVVQKRMPKPFNIYSSTLNSIL